jgi:hypothetical protein
LFCVLWLVKASDVVPCTNFTGAAAFT